MKRYYIVPPGALPQDSDEPLYTGEHHYIDLDSHPGHQTQPVTKSLGHDFASLDDWALPSGIEGTGHRVLVMMDERKEAHPAWEELPHLVDAQTTLGHPRHEQHLQLLQHLPCKALARDGKSMIDAKPSAEHGMYQLAKLLQSIHPLFRP